MAKIIITQIKSVIDRSERQKRTMIALGLKKINQSIEHEVTAPLLGMVEKVSHLLKVENKVESKTLPEEEKKAIKK